MESEKECGYNFFEEERLDVKSLVLFEMKERVKKRDFKIEGLNLFVLYTYILLQFTRGFCDISKQIMKIF